MTILPKRIPIALTALPFMLWGAAAAQPALPAALSARTIQSTVLQEPTSTSAPRATAPSSSLFTAMPKPHSWRSLAAELVKNYTVVVPDLRGIGRSSLPTAGYDKKTQAADIRAVVTTLGYDRACVG